MATIQTVEYIDPNSFKIMQMSENENGTLNRNIKKCNKKP